jgi:hypothetical protein
MEQKKTLHRAAVEKDRILPDAFEVGTEGSVGFDYIVPSFSAEWDGLFIKAVFQTVRGRRIEVVYTGDPVPVPVEVMRHSGDAGVIFSGYRLQESEEGNVVFPKIKTLPCRLTVLHTLEDDGANTIPSTPGTYEQLRAAVQEDLKKGLEEAAASGKFKGDPGEPGKQGKPGPMGPSAVYLMEEGENIEDVPPEYDVAIRLYGGEQLEIFDRGITAILRTDGNGSPGTFDTYTIFFSDNTIMQYEVYNGADGRGFRVLGYYNTFSDLEASVDYPNGGDAYGVGESAPYTIYIFDEINGVWVDNGVLSGVPGKSVEMRVSGGYIQWRQEGELWQELIPVESLHGRGILRIDRTDGDGSAGTVDTYTITFTDGSTTSYTVTNGEKIHVSDTVTEDGADPVSGGAVYSYVNGMIGAFLNGAS